MTGAPSANGSTVVPFADEPPAGPAVRGFLHRPTGAARDGLVLTHGAGSACGTPLLVALARACASRGLTVLRCDLPFRQARPTGPPFPAGAARDREGLRRAVLALRRVVPGRVFLGGHSYGGRQASILAADDPGLVDALLLLSYPLHAPRRPSELRTGHFPRLHTRALFAHGTRDPFGSPAELRTALALIPAPTTLLTVDGRTHDLLSHRAMATTGDELAGEVVSTFLRCVGVE